jgi:hypothetical protein
MCLLPGGRRVQACGRPGREALFKGVIVLTPEERSEDASPVRPWPGRPAGVPAAPALLTAGRGGHVHRRPQCAPRSLALLASHLDRSTRARGVFGLVYTGSR